MKELRPGDTKTFEIGGHTLAVAPLPFGKLKKLIRMVADVSARFEKKEVQDNLLTIVPALVEEYVEQFIPLLFDRASQPFLTKEWIEDNITVPMIKEIIVAAIQVNALGDFFNKTAKAPAPLPVEESGTTNSTLSEKSGSTTSSDSPTVGDLATSTT